MLRLCNQRTSRGKGNLGMFYERSPNICAAGAPTAQAEQDVAGCLREYSLQDEVDALIRDSIMPYPKLRPLGTSKREPQKDLRNAGPFSAGAALINPPTKSKYQIIAEDLKCTVYSSYWKKNVGTGPDPTPLLPEGFEYYGTRLGKKNPDEGRLYDLITPKNPMPDKTPLAKRPGRQLSRNYCESFDPNQIFGMKTHLDPSGKWMKCCLTEERQNCGARKPIPSRQADFRQSNTFRLGVPLAPNNNISCVPSGHTFGLVETDNQPLINVPECMTTCEINSERAFFKQCLAHLNTLRKCLKKRFDAPFFKTFYLKLKFFDKNASGWLPKDFVYDFCFRRYIRFNQSLLEPLLATWNAFDGQHVKYKDFTDIINHTLPTPDLPKVWDVPEDCIDFNTTYSEMVKPGQELDLRLRAGLPSGRYFDMDYPVTPLGCCKADRTYLPHESDAKVCLSPSIFTLLGVDHRDMYARRTQADIRKVFEAAGETFTDNNFEELWKEAQKYHSQGWVCFETFRRALNKTTEKIHNQT